MTLSAGGVDVIGEKCIVSWFSLIISRQWLNLETVGPTQFAPVIVGFQIIIIIFNSALQISVKGKFQVSFKSHPRAGIMHLKRAQRLVLMSQKFSLFDFLSQFGFPPTAHPERAPSSHSSGPMRRHPEPTTRTREF